MLEQTTADIAWAAGIWEGEGCWGVYRLGPTGKINVQSRLGMTDADVVFRFAAIVGFGTVRARRARRPHEKPLTEWYTQRRDLSRQLTEMFWPYLGERRRAKAQEVLDYGPAHPLNERTVCPKGHLYFGDNLVVEPIVRAGVTYLARRCKACRKAQSKARQLGRTRRTIVADIPEPKATENENTTGTRPLEETQPKPAPEFHEKAPADKKDQPGNSQANE